MCRAQLLLPTLLRIFGILHYLSYFVNMLVCCSKSIVFRIRSSMFTSFTRAAHLLLDCPPDTLRCALFASGPVMVSCFAAFLFSLCNPAGNQSRKAFYQAAGRSNSAAV